MTGTASAPSPVAARLAIPQLTSLRFFAALLVLGSHLTLLADSGSATARATFAGLLREGYCGVSFFFLLSGFVMAHAYGAALASGAVRVREYLVLRLVRLGPLHWAVTLPFVLWLMLGKGAVPASGTVLLNLGMLHAWSPDPAVHYSLNGPSWSLACELFFYATFPALVRLRTRWLCVLFVGGLAFVALAASIVVATQSGYSAIAEWLFYAFPLTRLTEFVGGMLLYQAHRRGVGRRLASTAGEVTLIALLPTSMIAFVALDLPMPFRWQLAYLPVMAALVLCFAYGHGAVSRLLYRPWLVLLGEASFALYLTHRPILTFAQQRLAGSGVDPLLLASVLLPACVLVSVATWRWFDRPVQRWLRPAALAWLGPSDEPAAGRGSWRSRAALALASGVVATGAAAAILPSLRTARPLPPPATTLGINLYGLAPYNRQQVFADLTAQSEWFVTGPGGWTPMPRDRLDAHGTVRALAAGEVAPRPLVLPPIPFGAVPVRCTYKGKGALSAGGAARVTATGAGTIDLTLAADQEREAGAWVQLDQTDPADPLRDLHCRDRRLRPDQLFHPAFLASLRGFGALRFLDWQRVNDNPQSRWSARTLPGDSSQAGPGGVALEHMVALANEARVDPWFIMPYDADDAYVAAFAAYVHDHLTPGRRVYVELGNEVWNDMFAATRQARREGLALRLAADSDPVRAQMYRYAQKSRAALRLWTRAFADRPDRLVRVVSSINVWPDIAEMVLGYEDLARWVDALATAPYIQLDLAGRGPGDVDWVFARTDAAITDAIDHAARNRAIAARYGKRYIAYEGGQHLVTSDLVLARAVQRDPRMTAVYARYLDQWRDRIGDRLMLYASTAPIGDSGAWGLSEYAGQPGIDAPKRRAVEAFLARRR